MIIENGKIIKRKLIEWIVYEVCMEFIEGKYPPKFYLPAYRKREKNTYIFCFIPFLPFYWGWKVFTNIIWSIYRDMKELLSNIAWFNYLKKSHN